MLREWGKFLKDNPSFGPILVILFIVAFATAPVHPQICAPGEQYPCKDVVSENLLAGFLYYMNHYSSAIIAFFTFTLWISTRRQAVLTRDIAKLGRDEFNATHRPKIITRFFRVNTTERGVGLEKWTNILFYIVNEGSSDAIVTEVGTRVFNWPGPYTRGAREIEFNVKQSKSILGAGEEVPLYTEPDFPRALTLVDRPENSSDIWWCIGYIKYRDANGTGRVTGFCRKWDFKSKTWDREPNDDWEYSY